MFHGEMDLEFYLALQCFASLATCQAACLTKQKHFQRLGQKNGEMLAPATAAELQQARSLIMITRVV